MTVGRHSNVASTGLNITANVTIGSYTSIGPYVSMHTLHNHACIEHPQLVSTAQLSNYPPTSSHEKINIGSDVWIGRNVTLLGDITIGHGAIIGAFSVVAKDIPPYAVVVGNPCVIKRYRFSLERIEKLLRIQWWNRNDIDPVDLLDVDSFIEKYSVII